MPPNSNDTESRLARIEVTLETILTGLSEVRLRIVGNGHRGLVRDVDSLEDRIEDVEKRQSGWRAVMLILLGAVAATGVPFVFELMKGNVP